ncbi:Fructose-bisphosphate aldolase class 2 [Candidatus Ecksteinia adelgidicola]|nr:Fructose-bisphosphate aldolase class 2 [Candidatus Ecksteinia adelgidicola]
MSKIFNFIKSGVVTGNDVQKIFTIAKENNFALPAINCASIDSINATLEAAKKMRAPVIIQFSYGGSAFIAGKGIKTSNPNSAAIIGAISAAHHVHTIAKYYDIPVILHTDHCSKKLLPWLDGLLEANEKYFSKNHKPLFSSHMIDLSEEPLEKNLMICSKYFYRMSKMNITLEIELGCTGGEEDGIKHVYSNTNLLYTRPKDVAYAYEKLHIISSRFIIAASFGNVHGVYKEGHVKLIPTILRDSQEYVSKKYCLPHNSLNFVFHGGSGSSNIDIKKSINYGVVKMNIDTDTQWAFWQGVLKYYKINKSYLQNKLGNLESPDKPNKKYYDPRIWIRAAQVSMIIRLEKAFKDLNAINVL